MAVFRSGSSSPATKSPYRKAGAGGVGRVAFACFPLLYGMDDPADAIIYYVVFLFSTTLHEAAHAWAAARGR